MRFVATILVVVQLLLRGVVVPHCHAHDGRPVPVDHESRPHIHLSAQSHSHLTGHRHSENEIPHHHNDQHGNCESPVTPEPADSPPPAPDHDEDAVYTGSEPLGLPLDRIQALEPTFAGWFLAEFQDKSNASLVQLIEYRVAGPPGEGVGTSIDLLPHLLRV